MGKTKNKGGQGFSQLYYRGYPIELRNDCPSGVMYFMTTEPEKTEDKILWAMRCMANDIEGKITWPWSKLVWKIRKLIARKTEDIETLRANGILIKRIKRRNGKLEYAQKTKRA